nr:GNAT family N-acetyltransferase [Sphingomonas sediminicola]
MAEIVAETERLRLRTWDPEDLDEFVRHTNTEPVMRWLGGVWPREKHEAALGRIERYQREFGHTFWIVERKFDGALLGFCGLKRVNSEGAPNPGDFEVGWRLREDAWGRAMRRKPQSRVSTSRLRRSEHRTSWRSPSGRMRPARA